jgi:DNA-binding MarR family transcriptional regulator
MAAAATGRPNRTVDQDRRGQLEKDAWGALLQVHADLVPLLDRQVQSAAGMPLAWYDVLLELNAAPDRRLRMGELGGRVVLSRTRVSRLIDELVGAGLVARENNPDDRRSAYAVLTDLGRSRLRAAAPPYLAGIAAHFGRHLSDEELDVLATALWRVHTAFTESRRQAVPRARRDDRGHVSAHRPDASLSRAVGAENPAKPARLDSIDGPCPERGGKVSSPLESPGSPRSSDEHNVDALAREISALRCGSRLVHPCRPGRPVPGAGEIRARLRLRPRDPQRHLPDLHRRLWTLGGPRQGKHAGGIAVLPPRRLRWGGHRRCAVRAGHPLAGDVAPRRRAAAAAGRARRRAGLAPLRDGGRPRRHDSWTDQTVDPQRRAPAILWAAVGRSLAVERQYLDAQRALGHESLHDLGRRPWPGWSENASPSTRSS